MTTAGLRWGRASVGLRCGRPAPGQGGASAAAASGQGTAGSAAGVAGGSCQGVPGLASATASGRAQPHGLVQMGKWHSCESNVSSSNTEAHLNAMLVVATDHLVNDQLVMIRFSSNVSNGGVSLLGCDHNKINALLYFY
jgi:hypothetical protein